MQKTIILLATLSLIPASIGALPRIAKQDIIISQTSTPSAQQKTKKPYTGIVKKVDDIAQAITVRIDSQKNGNGSGAIIAKQGDTYYVLTAYHVIKNQDKYTITTSPDGQVYKLSPEQIITISKDNDLAVVKFQSSKNYQIAQMASYQPDDQWLFVSGFPGNNSNKQRIITAGKVQKKEEKEFNVKDKYSLQGGRGLVYTNLSLPGMSGGPVLDLEGKLVGINTGAENETILTDANVSEINFGYALGVPITTFLGLASRSGIPTEQMKIVSTSPGNVQDKQVEEIKTQLLTFPVPSSNGTAKDWLNYGNELWRSFQYQKSVTAFDHAIKLLEGKSTGAEKEMLTIAYFGKGLALNDDKKYPEALQAMNRATIVDPGFAEAWRYQGYVLYELKQYTKALKAYQKAIQLNKNNFVLYVEQGDVFRELKSYPEAITSYNEAIKLKPEHLWAYNNRGLVYDDLKQHDKAIADYNQALRLNPKYALAYNNRGVAYFQLKQYDKAINDYNQALLINPKYAQANYNRGLVYYNKKQYSLAIADYSQAILIKHKYALAYNNRGSAYDDLKQYDKAIADYNQAILVDPKLSIAYNNRGVTYKTLKQYSLAINNYSQAINLDPKYINAYYNRGGAYLDLKQYDKAIPDYSQVILLDPKFAQAYNNRAQAYKNLKQYDKAIADYNQALLLDSKFADAYIGRSFTYLQLKQYDRTIADAEKAADLYTQQGDTEKAKKLREIVQQIKKLR